MKETDIDLLTTKQIAKKLISRLTFKGVLIYSKQASMEGAVESDKDSYNLAYNDNLPPEQIVILLRLLADRLEDSLHET